MRYKTLLFTLFFFATISQGFTQTKLDSLLTNSSVDSIKVQNLLGYAWQYKYSKPENAFIAVNAAVSTAQKSTNPKLIGNAFYYKGMMFYLTTQLDSAEYFSNRAIESYLQINNDYGVASIYNLKGLIYEKLSNYEGAIEQYLKSVEFAELTDNLFSQSNPLHNIGLIYEKIDEYEKGLIYYEKALKIREQIGDSSFIAASYMSISSINQYLKNDSLAIAFSKQAIDLFIGLDDIYNLMIAYNNLGQFYVLRDNLQKAEYFFEKSIGLTVPETYPENYLLSSANRIMLKNKQHKYQEAIQIGENSLKIVSDNDLMWNEKEVLNELANSYYALGLIDKTYHTQQRLLFLSDSLINEENLSHIADLETRFRVKENEADLAQKELEIVKKDVELKEKSAKIRLQIILIIVLIKIFVLLNWWYRVRRKQQKIKSQIAINEERNRIAMDLHDHVGAELTLVNSKLDTRVFKTERTSEKEDLEEISDQIRNVSKILRETVWSIQEEAITLEQLLERVQDFADKQLEKSGIEYSATSNENKYELTPQIALTFFRICQEGITNALKYSNASKIILSITKNGKTLEMLLTDDGNGFELKNTTSGYGLINMKQRAEQIGARFTITSLMGVGTTINVLIPSPIFLPV